ncbi:short palate, lung and nasal epithelium carcinoma-associated protein 2A-like [Bos javanicus]|uniref:short palate, lung and nasal epithelium carcinoma-associated protein 2A-like n=1 Tax=Bos javanicus TaxID=9906 RepID=UPI002AA93EC3|nr:short palate, lung and nasal epithelium carcinoma-associated protein 2A-like [Bos javanicus]
MLQVPAEVQVGDRRRLTLSDLELYWCSQPNAIWALICAPWTECSRCPDKMFQLWKRVLLCGLLPGTSASLLDSLGEDGLRKLKSGLEKGLDNLDSTLVTILEQLKTAEADPEKTEEAKSLLEQLISGIFEVVYRLTGVNISNLHILDITFEPASDGKGATLKIPITAEVNVNLPVLGEIVDLALNLVLQYSVSVETHEETKVSKVVMEECRSDQQSTKLTMLGRRIGLLTEVVDFAINLVNEVLSLVTHYELCPLVRSFFESLDADYLKNRIAKSQLREMNLLSRMM